MAWNISIGIDRFQPVHKLTPNKEQSLTMAKTPHQQDGFCQAVVIQSEEGQ
jgi:hypothetical protein